MQSAGLQILNPCSFQRGANQTNRMSGILFITLTQAYIVGTAVAAILTLWYGVTYLTLSPAKKRVFWFSVILTGMGAYLTIRKDLRDDHEKAVSATFGEMNSPEIGKKDVVLQIGNNVGSDTDVLLSVDPNTNQKAWKENGKLMLQILVRDARGEAAASIMRTEWKLYGSGLDYNNDETAYELVTPDGRVIFQLELKNDTAFANGLLCGERGNCTFSDDNGTMDLGVQNPHWPIRFNIPQESTLKPIFKYPRNSYLGIRVIDN